MERFLHCVWLKGWNDSISMFGWKDEKHQITAAVRLPALGSVNETLRDLQCDFTEKKSAAGLSIPRGKIQ